MTGTLTAPLWFALIFLVPTLFLFQGKWSFIIPGYNMMPPSEKRKFKEEKLCRAMAWMMLTMTLGFTATGVSGYLVETGRAELELVDTVKYVFLLAVVLHGSFTWWFCKNKCRK